MDSTYFNHPSFLYASCMENMCSELFRLIGLNGFSYSRVFQDGSRAELWTDVLAMEHSFLNKGYIKKVYTPDLLKNKESILYEPAVQEFPEPIKSSLIKQLNDQKELFDHDNCFFLIKHEASYTEYCIFYTSTKSKQGINTYFNNLDSLKKFRDYFVKEGIQMINHTQHERLIKPWREVAQSDLLSSVLKVPLSSKEVQILRSWYSGKSAREIAEEKNLSSKTVEAHLHNIRNKTGCRKKFELLKFFEATYL